MPLEMKSSCLRCSAPLKPYGIAFVCSFECTWCGRCAHDVDFKCTNCGGELVRRPRRITTNP